MVFKTYSSSLKTIYRSPLTWGTVILVFIIGLKHASTIHYGAYDINLGRMVWDIESGFVITYKIFLQEILNTTYTESLMQYSIPALCVIVSGIVLTRDWKDNYFEVECSCGNKSSHYILGRLLAVLSFVSSVALVVCFFSFNFYVVSRGGVSTLTVTEYLVEAFVRLIRVFVTSVFPGILYYISFTFFASTIMHSGVAGVLSGLCYVVFIYLSKMFLRFRLPALFKDYLSPTPFRLYQYWATYDTEMSDYEIINHFSQKELIICMCSLYLISCVFIYLTTFLIKYKIDGGKK